MPAKMSMFLSNGNRVVPVQSSNNIRVTTLTAAPKPPSSLTAPMINRVHTAKQGCSSCGR